MATRRWSRQGTTSTRRTTSRCPDGGGRSGRGDRRRGGGEGEVAAGVDVLDRVAGELVAAGGVAGAHLLLDAEDDRALQHEAVLVACGDDIGEVAGTVDEE